MNEDLAWFSAIVLFRTDISAAIDERRNPEEFSISVILLKVARGSEFAAAREMAMRHDDEMPFYTGWEFIEVLDAREVSTSDLIIAGTEVYSFFLDADLLKEIRNQM